MSFSPVRASQEIKEKYQRYIKTTFKVAEPYKEEFSALIDNESAFSTGPYLEVTDAFSSGVSIEDLISEGLLPKSFAKINVNLERPLYKHQEIAIRHIAEEKRNLVVSTGTGSGKTESFLIPVLRELAFEAENKTLCPGVRALLIYPMNALANDQTERLRYLLENFPEITFGVYTGQTKQREEDALADYKSLNQNRLPLKNELISRDRMIATPPHILITNYAMLEYLMLRPRDSVFFDGKYSKYWKFIVFDEAHVYNGSTGIEVSMLFRRLKARIDAENITFILTSATLGDEKDDDEVAGFARGLCDADFDRNDVVRAKRIVLSPEREKTDLPVSFYESMANAINSDKPDQELLTLIDNPKSAVFSEALYDCILHDRNYWSVRSFLKNPETVEKLAENMSWNRQQIADFVTVASKAEKNGGKLFDARYHMFLKATESAFVTLAPDNRIMLTRQDSRYNIESNQYYKVFEIATCSYCGSVYLIGKIQFNRLEQYNQTDDISEKEVFLLAPEISDTDEDHTLEEDGAEAEEYKICPYCGFLQKKGATDHCEHSAYDYLTVYRVNFRNATRTLTKCLNCENTNGAGVLRMFFSGQEAATSVIGTALFEALPSYKSVPDNKTEAAADNDDEDDFGFEEGYTETHKNHLEKTAKQFIAFSDSRQAAAFYASYLNITYNNILYKRLITDALKQTSGEYSSVPAFVDMLINAFNRNDVRGKISFDADELYNVKKEAWKAVLSELIDNNGNTSLSRYGLIGIGLNVRRSHKKYNLSEDDLQAICSIIGMTMMTSAAIKYDAPLNNSDKEDFAHGGVEYYYSLSISDAKRHVKSFMPTRAGLSNRRVDYLIRVLAKKGIIVSPDEAAEFLKKLWENVLIRDEVVQKCDGDLYRINSSKIQIFAPKKWYICKKCQKLTCFNVESVCPSYRCDGYLEEVCPEIHFSDNHYYRLYTELEPRDLRVVEHTAQLNRDQAYDYQKRFKLKEIDVLSCSTTFEMGVDVGSLETVFMRNVPPSPANYAQRAGRAGRSSNAAAFALTFCNKSSHDFSYFNDPIRMIKGKIDPPKYKVDNDRIAIRHLYAAAISYFWRVYPFYFSSIGTFLEVDDSEETGFDHLKRYLLSKPDSLKNYLLKWLPGTLIEKYDVENYGWLDSLIGDEGILTEAVKTFQFEVSLLTEAKQERFELGKTVDGIIQRINSYNSENILSFLSKKNVLPKYGFPVDTVEMTIFDNKRKSAFGLQLQRDLSMAISEYAPGSQIVANNNLITSRYIKKIPGIGWKTYSYIRCNNCKTLNIKPYTEGDETRAAISECCQCHTHFHETPKAFLIPAQGFVADGGSIRKPGLKKPERTYRGEISYVGFNQEAEIQRYNIGRAIVDVLTSQNDEMAVLNTSPFYVCSACGYTEIDEKMFTWTKQKKHNNSIGSLCFSNRLKNFSLGYRFLTDVVQIRFINYSISDYEKGLSILYGMLRSICTVLNIEENEISGCLQSYPADGGLSFALILFDNTPGGAGHVKRLVDPLVLENIFRYALSLMRGCVCGGESGDSSCYSCLRNYRNQKYHDVLKRQHVIEFLGSFLD